MITLAKKREGQPPRQRAPGWRVVCFVCSFAVAVWLVTRGCASLGLGPGEVAHFKAERSDLGRLTEQDVEAFERLGLTPREPVTIRNVETGQERKVHGRFLHITDMHPDSYYKEGSSIENGCHSGKPSGKKDYASRFGDALMGCDPPEDLVDFTLDWIKRNLKDKIDFVVWTGDNVRHDNDRRNPRTEMQILDMNDQVSRKMHRVFSDPNSDNPRDFDVTLIPSIGNNDVFPHNMFALGPTLQTREYYRIWSHMIPQEQQRTFDRGACFVTEVIPGKLAVLSINTLYLYKANPLVDNCDSKKQPGYQLLTWLGSVLEEMRQRGVKVWLSGHVPPIEKNYADSCYDKFTLWTHEYRDIIIGGLYGHMNMDHFIPVDGEASRKALEAAAAAGVSEDGDYDDDEIMSHAMAASEAHLMGAKPENKESYMNRVRDSVYKKIDQQLEQVKTIPDDDSSYSIDKKRKKPKTLDEICESYSIVTISGSVIPTFNPSIRIWEYNITDLETDNSTWQRHSWDAFYQKLDEIMNSDYEEEDDEIEAEAKKSGKNRKKKGSKADKTIPRKKPESLPLGPAYTPQLFSPTKFVQYYADLKEINKEYYKLIKSGKKPEEAAQSAFKFQLEYTSDDDPYPMKSLTVKDYISLASKLANDEKVWKKFLKRSFMSTGYTDDK